MFRSFCVVVTFAMFLTSSLRAEDKPDADAEVAKKLAKIVALGSGPPQAIKKDGKGRIVSCVVVGQSRISTVLGKAKGLEIARQRATLDAKANFVKWLKESVSVHQKSEDETILFLEGSEENDKEVLKESGKSVEKDSKTMESIAQGLVRGFQTLHVEQNDKDKLYTIVMAWDASTSEATKKVSDDLKATDAKQGEANSDKKSDAPPKKIDKKIEDKKVTSPDAKKFID